MPAAKAIEGEGATAMTMESIKLMPVRIDPTLLAEIANLQQVNNGRLIA
jgi:hypothetical protein